MNYTLKDLKKEIPHLDRLTKKNIGDILDYYKHQINV